MQGEENQYTLYLKEHPALGYYFRDEYEGIPEDVIVLNSENDQITSAMIHESEHAKQDKYWLDLNSSDYISNDRIIGMLEEGHCENQVEYVRDINFDSITKVSESGYKLFVILYNKLSYLVGERETDEYIKEQDISLENFLSEKLDEKYGEGTGQEFYQAITNLSFWLTPYAEKITQEKLDNIRNEIIQKNQLIEQKLEEEVEKADYYNKVLTTNKNYEEMLNTIDSKASSQFVEGETDFEKLTIPQRNIELQKLEKLNLKCINQDINNISSKDEALDYIQLWDYYRNRCSIPKNTYDKPDYLLGREETDSEKNLKLLSEVQHNLYKKCMEYGALNIQDETLFDTLIEAQLYDLSSATISYEQKGSLDRKLIISDQYVTNEIDVKEKKDGDRQLSIDKLYKGGGMEGTKILAQKEKKTLKDKIIEIKEEITCLDR